MAQSVTGWSTWNSRKNVEKVEKATNSVAFSADSDGAEEAD